MESKDILEVLKQINEDNTYKKIFINGAWGIGKSYYTGEYIKENIDNFVYVTLFGKANFDSVEDALAKELMKRLPKLNKGKKVIKNFFQKISGSISYNGFSINTPQLARKGIISEYSSLLDSKSLVIVIDDLERKSGNILIEDIMGMIEEFSQFDKVKLVIIGDESNIHEKDREKWEKFKEKIIEKEYIIQKFSDESIDNLVNKEIGNYVIDNEIQGFVNDFIKKHKVKNLRTIIKGINLFKEINNNYIKDKGNEKINLMLLKNCMSVAIECTESIYKPKEEDKEKNSFQYSIDEDILSRIIHHYFNSICVNNNESCALYYVLRIFNCNFDQDTIKELNDTIKSYLNIKMKGKNIFYLSENQISNKICELYKSIIDGTYIFSSLDQFIDDSYEIATWNDALKLDFKVEEFSSNFNKILFDNFYSFDKNIYQNTIDRYELIRRESRCLSDLINNYNKEVNIKYSNDRLLLIEKSYKDKKYDENLLEWLDMRLMQEDKQIIMEKFIYKCRQNQFFIPDLSGEISDNIWGWTHKIWKIFYEKMDEEYKCELNKFVENLKNNKLSSYRINVLQEYRPLIAKENH